MFYNIIINKKYLLFKTFIERNYIMTKQIKKEEKVSKEIDLSKFETKSAKIRYLNSVGKTRSEIAKILEIRYQHVRNVLITPLKRKDS